MLKFVLFKIQFLSKIASKIIKNSFSELLWILKMIYIYPILDQFWQTKIFILGNFHILILSFSTALSENDVKLFAEHVCGKIIYVIDWLTKKKLICLFTYDIVFLFFKNRLKIKKKFYVQKRRFSRPFVWFSFTKNCLFSRHFPSFFLSKNRCFSRHFPLQSLCFNCVFFSQFLSQNVVLGGDFVFYFKEIIHTCLFTGRD